MQQKVSQSSIELLVSGLNGVAVTVTLLCPKKIKPQHSVELFGLFHFATPSLLMATQQKEPF